VVGVLHRVLDQVGDHLGEPLPVAGHHRGGTVHRDLQTLGLGQRAQLGGGRLGQVAQVDRADEQLQATLVGLGQGEQVVHHPRHPLDLLGGAGEDLLRLRWQVAAGQRHLQLRAHDRQGGTQVM
jgi:hypothetical protein